MKNFSKGLVTGISGTILTLATSAIILEKVFIKPAKDFDDKFEATTLNSARKAAHSHGNTF